MKLRNINASTIFVGGEYCGTPYHFGKEDGIVICRSPLISGKGGQRYNCESRMLIDSIAEVTS